MESEVRKMMQRHTPLGYKIVDGKVIIDE